MIRVERVRMFERRNQSERRNLTIQLPYETIRRAKVLAAQQGTSVSRLVARTIERIVAESEAYESAKHRALELLERGFDLRGRTRASRDDLHGR